MKMKREELALKVGEMVYEDVKGLETLDLAGKLQYFISDAIYRLSLVTRVLNDDDTIELSHNELEGITMVINEVYSLLSMANKLYFEKEGESLISASAFKG